MPQMAPISWLILFFIFSISFMLFNILNFYCFYYQNNNNNSNMLNNNNNNKNKSFNTNNMNWKW